MFQSKNLPSLLAVALVLALGVPATADVVTLKNGGTVEGRIVEESATAVTLETKLGRVTLDRTEIQSIEAKEFEVPATSTREGRRREEYFEKLSQLDPADARGLAQLSQWCREASLTDEASVTEAMAIAIAPDDETVRKTLGHFRSHEGTWLTAEEYWTARGMVPYEGEWVTPEERVRRLGRDYSQSAHSKRRELSVRAKFELPNLAEGLLSADAAAGREASRALRERLDRYEEEGRPYLQGLASQHEALCAAVDAIQSGDFRDAREVCVKVMEACDGVLRWEESAARALEVAALKAALAKGQIQPTRREQEATNKINDMRRQMGMPALSWSEGLYRAAASHNLDMLAKGYVDHESPTPGQENSDRRAHARGVAGQIGENIYFGGLTAAKAVTAWGNSLGHAENLFDPGWRRAGLCAVGRHWTQNFAE